MKKNPPFSKTLCDFSTFISKSQHYFSRKMMKKRRKQGKNGKLRPQPPPVSRENAEKER
jgi:hypothetical protein